MRVGPCEEAWMRREDLFEGRDGRGRITSGEG